jgi:hypothetical protein
LVGNSDLQHQNLCPTFSAKKYFHLFFFFDRKKYFEKDREKRKTNERLILKLSFVSKQQNKLGSFIFVISQRLIVI